MNILIIVVLCAYLAFNILVAKCMSTAEMQHKFVDGQNLVGKIATNIFYGFAWILKGLKFVVVNNIK